MRALIIGLLLFGCGGESQSSKPTPLETACGAHDQCVQFCPEGQQCDSVVTCGFQSYCTIRCSTGGVPIDENVQACLEWGGTCRDIGGAEWCARH